MSRKLPKNSLPLRGALTGGIGAGKSIVAKVFEVLDIPVFYSDREAYYLTNYSEPVKEAIRQLLGDRAYGADDLLDRPYVATRVFSDPELREKLNEIVHPAVRKAFEDWVSEQDAHFVLNEAAIAFETGMHQLMDFTILVSAPEEIRIRRVVNRDQVSKDMVEKRMEAQWPEEKKRDLADYIIENDGNTAIIPQVLEVWKSILEKS
jgi:dephospho-CoA kinase